ncbi:MAG: ferredoxin [Myxococcota bacterium]
MSTATVSVDGYESFTVDVGSCLLDACEENGVPIESACGGFAACNSCRVDVTEMSSVSPLVEEEEAFLDSPSHRLACQCQVLSDVRLSLAPGM